MPATTPPTLLHCRTVTVGSACTSLTVSRMLEVNTLSMKFLRLAPAAITCALLLLSPGGAKAATGALDVAYSYTNISSSAQDGDILFASGGRLTPGDAPYSSNIFGVLQKDAIIVYKSIDKAGAPVARTGIANVNVSTLNGPIKKGDYVTSSALPGRGQKARESGYVLGIALDDFSGEGAQTTTVNGRSVTIGKIAVALRIEYAEIDTSRSINRLLEYLNAALFQNLKDPERFVQVIRYISAGLIVILAFGIGFITFSGAISKGVEGIGRNPLAKNAIQFSIIVNAILTVSIVLIGAISAFIMLRI